MAVGETQNPAVARGIDYLMTQRNSEGLWDEEHFTAVGFPRVFYLRYHGLSGLLSGLGPGPLSQSHHRECRTGALRPVIG